MESEDVSFQEAYYVMMMLGYERVHLFPTDPETHYAYWIAPCERAPHLEIICWSILGGDELRLDGEVIVTIKS